MAEKRNDEVMGYTHRGTQWEFIQSWPLLGLLTFYTFWVPLLYMGVRVFRFTWIFWGLSYAFASAVYALVPWPPEWAGMSKRYVFGVLTIAAIHAWRIRGDFLVSLSEMIDEREERMAAGRLKRDEVAQQKREEVTLAGGDSLRQEMFGNTASNAPAAPAAPPRKLLDLNAVGEQELAMLPGMGAEKARQAVALRQQLGGFSSFAQFAEKMGIAAAIRPKLAALFPPDPAPVVPEAPTEFRVTIEGHKVLEVNLASVAGFVSLGLDEETARRAVALRDSDGPYKNAEEFRYRLGLSMEVLGRIGPKISTLHTPVTRRPVGTPSKRIVDL